jgi:hypothetical protein
VLQCASATLNEPTAEWTSNNIQIGGAKFIIQKTQETSITMQWISKERHPGYLKSLYHFIGTHVAPIMPHQSVTCFSAHQCNGYLFYIDCGSIKSRPWHDWAYFAWDNEHIAAQIQCFIDLHQLPTNQEIHVNECLVNLPGLYAVVQSLQFATKHNVVGSKLIFKGQFDANTIKTRKQKNDASLSSKQKPKYIIVDVKCIVDPAFVIPNIGKAGEVLILAPKSTWKDYF